MHSVAVLTPTWNRCNELGVVYSSLLSQTFRDFEWIIVDDHSEDDTEKVVDNILRTAPFPVTYARYSKRVGKVRADNTLLDLNSSDFVVWCDSDDKLVPNALEKLVDSWKTIGTKDSKSFIGVVALCADPNGVIQSSGRSEFAPFVASWSELGCKYKMFGDMCIMQISSVIDDARFPEHDLVMSESGFWHQYMHLKVLCIPDVLKIMKRDTPNRISGSGKMEYCRGKAYSIVHADSSAFIHKQFREQIMLATNYHRYCMHGDIGFRKRDHLFQGYKNINYYIGALIGCILAFKDVAQGRVIKTHEIFDKGRNATYFVCKNI